MKRSISDFKVRKAVYRAYKRQCFFTGRFVGEEEMVIDHLIPKSKGGEDSFENYVLTFKDLNSGKSNKLDDELERMKWTVKNIFAPRARKIFNELCNKINCQVEVNEENNDILLKKFKTRIHPKSELKIIRIEDLFWTKDNKIEISTDSDLVSSDNAYDILKKI